ncbi:RNA-binding protein 38-like isoform X1 [Vigna unguiculata]|uniref:RNA-binding protein 38-like isoform X1 n=1 Tax=Vigna unguiculata TaxID=3917 RepID=UPI001015EF15|nr:RNA-binding protein 38-like isoform X1 [Vigna unguiculata]
MGGGNINSSEHIDTTSTKIFVGGLAWETQRDTVRRYFEQFGEILEAVVITDKNTGRSKGYGFITFKDPEVALKAVRNPYPIIDGRKTNCNIASIGANKNRRQAPQRGWFREAPGLLASPVYHDPFSVYHDPFSVYHDPFSAFFHQNNGQYTFPNSTFGRYIQPSHDMMYPMNCYGVLGGQQFSTYYPYIGPPEPIGLVHNTYPFSAQHAHNIEAQGFGFHYPQMMHSPVIPRHYGSPGILRYPSSMERPTISTVTRTTRTTTKRETPRTIADASQTSEITSEQHSSAESSHK